MISTFDGLPFEKVCDIKLETMGEQIKTMMPQDQYDNRNNLPLNIYGHGPFCKFKIPKRWSGRTGVYILLVDDVKAYVGECEDLQKRWDIGYGNISPRNCYEGGQSTNCRINNYIYKMTVEGKHIELYFHETQDRFNLEDKLITLFSPPQNRTNGRKKTSSKKEDLSLLSDVKKKQHIRFAKEKTGCREEILQAINIIIKRKCRNEFTVQEVVDQMNDMETAYGESTIGTHISSRMCSNSPDHHGTTYCDIERIRRGVYRRQ